MREYETLCTLHPELPETRIEELIAWMQRIVEGMKGQIRQVDKWGMRDLSYRIRKQRRGYYIRLEYEAEPEVLSELERNLRLSEDVLRFMSVRKEVGPERSTVQTARESVVEEKAAEPETTPKVEEKTAEPETTPESPQTPQEPLV